MAAYAIDACNLTKVFPGDVTAVNGLNLDVEVGSQAAPLRRLTQTPDQPDRQIARIRRHNRLP